MTTPKKHKGATRKPANAGGGSYRPPYCCIAEKMREMGATKSDLAAALNVTVATIDQWLDAHREFADAYKRGEKCANERVMRSLYHRAIGFEYDAEKLITRNGQLIRVTQKVYVPPDPRAAMFWLKNRERNYWSDRPEELEENPDHPLQQLAKELAGTALRPKDPADTTEEEK